METAFDIKKGVWDISWPGRVSQYDVVFHRPPFDPMNGMPVGNGEIGVLCWCEESRIIMAVNRSDLWDDNPDGHFTSWSAEAVERGTTLRHACRIVIDFGVPIFSDLYYGKCDSRLSISDASGMIDVCGPFGAIKCKFFVADNDAICCEVSQKLTERLAVKIAIERFGSRNYAHWFCEDHSTMPGGLLGTKSATGKDTMYLSHRLTCGTFTAGLRVKDAVIRKAGSHKCTAEVKKEKFSFIATVTEPRMKGSQKLCGRRLDDFEDTGINEIFNKHQRVWKKFWLRSLMDFGDEYLTNVWYLTMYYARASQRGRYPGRFINGMWTWARDVQPWAYYYHWNQQQTYWPLNAAGHHDLLESYLNFRFNTLDIAKDAAVKFHNCDGAYVSDVTDRRGYCSEMEKENHTPVAQVAQQMWDQYLFTQDKDFLRQKALPYMIETAVFFAGLFEKGRDGKYHARGGTGYEGGRVMKDVTTELASARALFDGVLAAMEIVGLLHPQQAKWRDIFNNMAEYLTVDALKTGLVGKTPDGLEHKTGIFKGTAASSAEVIAGGFELESRKIVTSLTRTDGDKDALARQYNLESTGGIFPMMELSVVFPSNTLGLGQKGSELFDMMRTTVKAYAFCDIGWAPMPIALARLGLGNELEKVWHQWLENFQWFANGWGQYAGRNFAKENPGYNTENRFNDNLLGDLSVRVPGGCQLIKMNNWMSRHMGTESMSIFAAAMNESLLQSHDGIIRIAPATGDSRTVRFTLHARGGFEVSAEVRKGKVVWAAIKSLNANKCRVSNPWKRTSVFRKGKKIVSGSDEIIEFDTDQGGIYLLAESADVLGKWNTVRQKTQANQKPRRLSETLCLGIERIVER